MVTSVRRASRRFGTVSWIRVGVVVLTISGAGLLAGIVLVHRAGIPHRPKPVSREDSGAIEISFGGTVHDLGGEALPGADVYLALWRGKAGLGTVGHVVTDATGGYRFPSVQGYDLNHPTRRRGRTVADWPYSVFAAAPGRGFVCLKFEPVRNYDDGNLRLHPEHRVSGMVTDATGDPLAGTSVSLRAIEIPDATGTPQQWFFASVRTGTLPPILFTTTDSNGGFVLSGLPSADGVEINAELDGYFTEWSRGVSEKETVSIVLRKEMKLRGKVVLEGSSLGYMPAFKLTARRSQDNLSLPVGVRTDGSFHRVLKTGHYEITLDSAKYEADPVHVHLTLESSGRPVTIKAWKTPREGDGP